MVRKYWNLIFIGTLILIIFLNHSFYVYKTYQFPLWDESVYMQYAVNILSSLKNPTLHLWQDILQIVQHRQPFFPLLIALPLLLFGTTNAYKIALLINGLFYAGTIIFIYKLGREFLGKLPSVLASYMFAFYGFPLFYIHFAFQETTATFFTTGAFFFLTKAAKSSSLKHTFLLSLFTAIGVLTRWAVPIFIIGPLLITFYKIAKRELTRKKIHLKPVVNHFSIFLTLGVFLPLLLYYLPNSSLFIGYVEANRAGGSQWAPDAIKNSFSKASISWYLGVFAQQTIFFWILFIIGFLIAIVRYKKYLPLLLALTIPYLFFTFGSTWKDDRFIVPIYPIMAILSAVVIEELKKHFIKNVIVLLILVIGFLNFLGASWGIGPMKFSIHGNSSTVPHSIVMPMPIGHPRRVWLAPISWPPRTNEGNVPLILDTIKNSYSYGVGGKPTILLAFDFPQISGPLATDAIIETPDLFTFTELYSTNSSYTVLFHKLNQADYLLVKTGRVFDEPRRGQDVVAMIELFNKAYRQNNGDLLPEAFTVLKKVRVPIDNSTITIYQKIRAIEAKEWLAMAKKLSEIDPTSTDEILKGALELQLKR